MDKQPVNILGRVGVLMGGCSSEREISLKSGRAVLQALCTSGVDARQVLIDSEDPEVNRTVLERADLELAFIAMHGRYGEDGGIQSVLDAMGIPYPGSGPAASRLAMNKAATQTVLREAGLPVADFCVLEFGDVQAAARARVMLDAGPVVVKPASEGSSIGVCIVRDEQGFERALLQGFGYGRHVLVEQFILGRELTVGILDDHPLPAVEIRAPHGFFDFEAKYQKGATAYLVPAPLDSETAQRAGALGLAVFRAVGCRDFARVDLLLSGDGRLYILEINTIPGFTETSLLPMAAASAGYDFSGLCLALLSLARQRQGVSILNAEK